MNENQLADLGPKEGDIVERGPDYDATRRWVRKWVKEGSGLLHLVWTFENKTP